MRHPDDRSALSRRDLLGSAAWTGAALTAPAPLLGALADADAFPLIAGGRPAAVLVDPGANPAVLHVADSFAADLERVSGRRPVRLARPEQASGPVVVIGVLGHSPAIDRLTASGRIDAADIAGEWEAFRQIVVDHPFPGVPRALVIVGSDRRGTVFGTYDLSERIGVSPWHWFADVPVPRRTDVMIPAGSRRDQPRVRYRGFFINDEDPAFSGWAIKRFGGINHLLYAHVFELLLRLKGNYLWPAMWTPKAFNDDDPQNMVLADAMGIVMGTSHHEPLTRAHDEWHRDTAAGVTGGKWDYRVNGENLRRFWCGGVERMMSKGGRGYETVLTVGMRGDGDEAMAEGTATELLERIVADQRRIIAGVTGRPAAETPQVWALYKEVQDYYDHGMQVPDDVTLLFSDDNWGQIRRLPRPGALSRSGGYGVYYHFDYVGGPRNYKWINTNQIEKTWQQMDLAYARGARAMWIVNVGDIKPMEYPLSFFMAQAWNPAAMTPAALAAWPRRWAAATFGPEQAGPIGELITDYSRLAARRKPELIAPDTFPLGPVTSEALDGGAFGAIVAEWDGLEARMLAVGARLGPDWHDAWYQLVEFPIAALANLYRLHYAVAWNRRLAARSDPRADWFADRAEVLYARDRALTDRYHRLRDGKWDGMMNQVHMGYTGWNDPKQQAMPAVARIGGRAVPRFAKVPVDAGTITIEATAYTRLRNAAGLRWTAIPHLGRGKGAMLALPQGKSATTVADAMWLEYDVVIRSTGPAAVTLALAPTLDTTGSGPPRIGLSLDNGPVHVLAVDLHPTNGGGNTPGERRWADAVRDNMVYLPCDMGVVDAGRHVIKLWRFDDNVVLQGLEIRSGARP